MYRYEIWTIKKAESQRVNAFELWCCRRLLTARRSNKSVLKEIKPEYSLEGLMLKLKLQYFGHLMQRADSMEKTLMMGKIEGKRRRGWQRERLLDSITDSMDMSLSKHQELVMHREACHATVHGVAKNRAQISDWTTIAKINNYVVFSGLTEDLSSEYSLSDSSEKLFQRGKGETRICRSFSKQTKKTNTK